MTFLKSMFKDQAGATAIEYGLLAALIGVAIIVAVQGTGNSVSNIFMYASNSVSNSL